MKTIKVNVQDYMQGIVADLVEEFVEMYELSGSLLSETGASKLVVARELLVQAINEMIVKN